MTAEVTHGQQCTKCGQPMGLCQCATVRVSQEMLDQMARDIEAMEFPPLSPIELDAVEGRYNIIEKIGVGGMGTVYRAQHVVLLRQVAIKVLRTELLSDTTAMARFEQESRACAALSHINLVSVYDCGITKGGQPYLVMEFLIGESLMDIIKEHGAINAKLFLDIFIDVCKGLSYAHSEGVIHRDLKPSNIILTEDPRGGIVPKVVDFGVAKIEDLGGEFQMLTRTGEVFGSPAYMSPEQCQGHAVDQRSDIYALGCVMYECLSGKQAFKGANIMTIMRKQLEEYPARPVVPLSRERAPAQLIDAIMICMNKNPDNRYQTIAELQHELEQVRDGLLASRIVEFGKFRLLSERLTASFLVFALLACLVLYPVLLPGGSFNDYFGGFKKGITLGTSSPVSTVALGALFRSRNMEKSAKRNFDSVVKNKNLGLIDRLAVCTLVCDGYYDAQKYKDVNLYYKDSVAPLISELQNTKDAKVQKAAGTFAPLIFRYVGGAEKHSDLKKVAEAKFMEGIRLAADLKSPRWVTGKLKAELGELYFESDEYNKAIPMLRDAQELLISDPTKNEQEDDINETTGQLVKCLTNMGRPDDAIVVLTKTVTYELRREHVNNDHSTALIKKLINLYEHKQMQTEAQRWYDKLSELVADGSSDKPGGEEKMSFERASYVVLLQRASWLNEDGIFQLELFEQSIDKAIESRASDLEICSAVSVTLRTCAERSEARDCEKIYEKVLPILQRIRERAEEKRQDGKTSYTGAAPMIYYYMGLAEYNTKQFKQSLTYIPRGLSLCEGQPDANWMRGRLHHLSGQNLVELGRYEEAKKDLVLALSELVPVAGKKNGLVGDCFFVYAKACDRTNSFRDAKNAIQNAITSVQGLPDHEWRRRAYMEPFATEIANHERDRGH